MILKHVFCLSLTIATVQFAAGQEYKTDCANKYFAHSRVLSTSICYDKDRRWGKAIAFDRNGKKIYENGVRNIGGTAGVTFSYYDDGAVKTAHYHSQPDGGIQWYDVLTHFSQEGVVTGEDDNGYDRMHNVLAPPAVRKPPTPPAPPKQEVAKCAVPYATEFWFINDARFPMIAIAQRKGNAKDIKALVLQPSDTVKGGEFIMAKQFVNLSDYYDFTTKPVADIPGKFIVQPDKKMPFSYKKEVRRCYYHIARK